MHPFTTDRLTVAPWGADLTSAESRRQLERDLEPILTPKVLRYLPEALGMSGDGPDAIAEWIAARDAEATVCTIRLAADRSLIGLLILAMFAEDDGSTAIHLGYLFEEDAWGRGYGTELVRGLVENLRGRRKPARLYAGVAAEHDASATVLKKAGFKPSSTDADTQTILFILAIP